MIIISHACEVVETGTAGGAGGAGAGGSDGQAGAWDCDGGCCHDVCDGHGGHVDGCGRGAMP